MENLPHNQVYTRIGVSQIHGIGVIAIMDIPENTYLFEGDDSEIIWLNEEEIHLATLPPEVKELYTDFSVIVKDQDVTIFGCPKSFNNMPISWYLNHSSTPNVICDKQYNFYTIREIKKGEELTVDYATYSDEFRKE